MTGRAPTSVGVSGDAGVPAGRLATLADAGLAVVAVSGDGALRPLTPAASVLVGGVLDRLLNGGLATAPADPAAVLELAPGLGLAVLSARGGRAVGALLLDPAEVELAPQASASACPRELWDDRARAWRGLYRALRDARREAGAHHELSRRLADGYEELALLHRVATSWTLDLPLPTLLANSCEELREALGLRWMALWASDDAGRMGSLAGRCFRAGLTATQAGELSAAARWLGATFGSQDRSLILEDVRRVELAPLGLSSGQLLVTPLTRGGVRLGVLFGADKRDHGPVTSLDTRLCDAMGGMLATLVDHAVLYEGSQAMYTGTLHALSAAIDAKDAYTHGHSDRVAWLGRALAEACRLDPDTVERVYLAGLVHDVGKIGVPEAVLGKTAPLTDAEFALIREHPRTGGKILQDIPQMHDLIPGVVHHHERWDGGGYPDRLAGEGIPLFGRLIALADSFDAMCSNRTYRRSLPRDRALQEVERCAGTQFDPALAKRFLALDLDPYFTMVERAAAQAEADGGVGVGVRAQTRRRSA